MQVLGQVGLSDYPTVPGVYQVTAVTPASLKAHAVRLDAMRGLYQGLRCSTAHSAAAMGQLGLRQRQSAAGSLEQQQEPCS
jgi:hypothetical protein